MHYRKATIEDIPELARIRKMQLHDEGPQPEEMMDEELETYFSEKMADGSLIQWVAEDDNRIIATGAIIFMDFPPSFTNKSGKQGYIANMYTRPGYRGKGIATEILERLIQEGKQRKITKYILYASCWGRPVYERYGFQDAGAWMELKL